MIRNLINFAKYVILGENKPIFTSLSASLANPINRASMYVCTIKAAKGECNTMVLLSFTPKIILYLCV